MMEKLTCFCCANTAVSRIEVHSKEGGFYIDNHSFCYKHLQEYWNIFGLLAISGGVTWIENRLDRGNNEFN